MARAAARSKAVAVLLLIHCLLLLPLFVGTLNLVRALICYALLSVISSFGMIFLMKRELFALL